MVTSESQIQYLEEYHQMGALHLSMIFAWFLVVLDIVNNF
jgi:hypothetical protein